MASLAPLATASEALALPLNPTRRMASKVSWAPTSAGHVGQDTGSQREKRGRVELYESQCAPRQALERMIGHMPREREIDLAGPEGIQLRRNTRRLEIRVVDPLQGINRGSEVDCHRERVLAPEAIRGTRRLCVPALRRVALGASGESIGQTKAGGLRRKSQPAWPDVTSREAPIGGDPIGSGRDQAKFRSG